MKFRIAVILILLGTFVSAAQAQSNCCDIQVGGVQITGSKTTVPPSASGPGGTYVSTQTNTYPIACVNSDTGKTCNLTSTPTNAVTATGYGANVNGNFIACNPTFVSTTSQASSSSGAAATFEDVGTSYTGVDANGVCTKNPNSPFAISSCAVVACQTTSSGGGGTCPKAYYCDPSTELSCSDPNADPCCCTSPIILDVNGKGFQLTNAASGVVFDMSGTGTPVQMGWTAPGAANAFLCLPDADGKCDDGKDLFGNFTPQPPTTTPNGFAALAAYDQPANGGNGDGIIDSRDAVFSSLRLWIDANHDGISQPEELHTLPSLGVNSISLTYNWSGRRDQYGNVFRYRAQVNPGDTTNTGRMAYDVFFVRSQPATKNTLPTLIPAGTQKCPVPGKAGILSSTGRF